MLQTTLLLRTNELCRCRREDRKITAVRVFVAAHEWIVECVGVVDIQSGEAFAAVFAPANEKDGRVSTGEAKDEALAMAVRQQDVAMHERAMGVEVAKGELEAAKAAESQAETDQINARRLRDSIAKELAESEAELAEREEASSRSRARWRASISRARAAKRRSRSPDPWQKAKELCDALAAATEPAGGRASSAPPSTPRKLGGTWSEEAEQQKIEARARARWRFASTVASALAPSQPRPWEADMVDERWEAAVQAAARRKRGLGDSFVTKQMGRPWEELAEEMLEEWCVTVGAKTLEEATAGVARGGKKVKVPRADVHRLFAALKEMGGAEVAWDGVADEVGAKELLIKLAQVDPDDVDRYVRFVLVPLAELQRHGWFEPPALARIGRLRLAEAEANLSESNIALEDAGEACSSVANSVVLAEHALLGAEAELRGAHARFEQSGGLLHRETPLASQGRIESETQRQLRRPARIEEMAASAELSWWRASRRSALSADVHRRLLTGLVACCTDNHKHHKPQRSEQGLKIEKKRRLAEEQEERDNELRKIGLFFDREAGMYMRD